MHFLARDEANLLEKKLRRQIADQPKPKLVISYKSSDRDYSEAANVIAKSIGEFTEAALHFISSGDGDGWNERLAANERWNRYKQWRSENGENRRLHDAPGHRFESYEAPQLSKAIEFALQLGWDAVLAANPGRHLMALSHDDRIEIYRGFDWRSLAEKLIALGYWHR